MLASCSAAVSAEPARLLATGPMKLPAEPAGLSVGPAGPFNRIAFELHTVDRQDSLPQVVCIYPGSFRYRCGVVPIAGATPAGRRRIAVVIPDLGRGSKVTLQFASPRGRQEEVIDLANAPQVVHEIEVLPLPGSRSTHSSGDGRTVAPPVTTRVATTPALAASPVAAAPACDQLRAEWVSVSATDPVFTGPLGPVKGAIAPARAIVPGSTVRPDNVPEWLITYPPAATRLQFIAHYEVIYRVGVCPQHVIAG